MSTKNDIRHLWREAFGDSEEYLDMYFDRIYRESDALTLESDGRLVSTVLMQDYNLWFHSREVPVAYIAGVTTRRAARGHGHATALVNKALKLAHHNGKMLCAIIPAHDWLYYFFDRFGFSPVFLTDSQRFTSLTHLPPRENMKRSQTPIPTLFFRHSRSSSANAQEAYCTTAAISSTYSTISASNPTAHSLP